MLFAIKLKSLFLMFYDAVRSDKVIIAEAVIQRSYVKSVPKNFAKFTGKHQLWKKRDSDASVFLWILHSFRTLFSKINLRAIASIISRPCLFFIQFFRICLVDNINWLIQFSIRAAQWACHFSCISNWL